MTDLTSAQHNFTTIGSFYTDPAYKQRNHLTGDQP
jgi:hypothetical protein